ncbi:exodeoxyribonuclease VII small subunit [Clostridium oryzae]|uniref:Exodeoxyribonuclease 7 small subunit n=1 Tax=Clostridium oryzae TaxID=1450648 RepID=A0A1V4ITH2_9CLOT|nr:exodeoxyribonuclease VII small subunit [Clostridium oryzae]OPJ63199.1 exodeoxyribonuclease 7 small subunit [Clostridium oryzae]
MAKKKENFEDIMANLETIVNKMENENPSLEEAIAYYEEGIKSCGKLYKILNNAEGKIKVLKENTEVDFEEEGKI